MGESTTITHAILTIAAVTIASIFAFVMLTKISALNSSVSQMIYSNVNSMESSVTIIDFYYSS
ncbi:MAG: flagellin, partial [Fervidicoccaceae archaeon]